MIPTNRATTFEPLRIHTPLQDAAILCRVACGKYSGCKLAWLSDDDLRDVMRLTWSSRLQDTCRRMLLPRWYASRRRVRTRNPKRVVR